MPMDETTVKVEVTPPETPASEAPPIVVVKEEPSAPLLEMAREAGTQSAELGELRTRLMTTESALAELQARVENPPTPPVIVEEETTEDLSPVIPVEVPPSSVDVEGPEKTPLRARGFLGRLFLGKHPAT